jgi:hypothetical protein
MQYSFSLLDYDVNKINNQTEDGNSLDPIQVKAIYSGLYSFDLTFSVPSLIGRYLCGRLQ